LVRGCSLGFAAAAISGELSSTRLQGATRTDPDGPN
jgi:hypothetical protein